MRMHFISGRRLLERGMASQCLVKLFFLALVAESVRAELPTVPSPFTNMAQIRQLSRTEARMNLPVQVQGVVTYWDPSSLDLYVQDDTDGINVAVLTSDLPLSVGRLIQINGVTSTRNFTRAISLPDIKVLPPRVSPPKPKVVAIRQFLTGSEDGRWIQVEGTVQYAQDNDGRLLLWLRSGGQKIQVVVLQHPGYVETAALIKSQMRIRGVCQTSRQDNRVLETARLMVNSFADDIEFVSQPDTSTSAARAYHIGDLALLTEAGLPDERIRISGLAFGDHAEEITLRDGTGSILVRPRNPVFTGLDYRTQAEGFLERDDAGNLVLADAFIDQWAPCRPQFTAAVSGSLNISNNVVLPIITEVKTLRELSEPEAMLGYPVHITGIVLWFSRPLQSFCLQDGTTGVFVDITNDFPKGFAPGCLVEVGGYGGRGSFAPFVREAEVRVIGERRLPAPCLGSPSDLASGLFDGRWVELEGIVRTTATNTAEGARFKMASGGTKFEVCFPTAIPIQIVPGEDAKIRVRGVCDILSRERRALRFQILVNEPSQIQQIRPPVDRPRLPLSKMGQLFSASVAMSSGHRVRIRGTVTLHHLPDFIYIGEETDGLRVDPRSCPPLQTGDQIEAIGFPALGEMRAVLEDAEVTRLGISKPLQPKPCVFASAINPDWDSKLITLKQVRLVERYPRGDALILVVESASQDVFEARCNRRGPASKISALEIGSRMDLTGICYVHADANRNPRSLALLLRSPDDVQNVLPPPFQWTPRLLQVLVMGALAFCFSLLWVMSLRRRVSRQMQIIRQQLERKAALEQQFHQAQKMESVGQLAAGVAHDFNNIMTVILGHGNLLSSEPGLPAEAQESCHQIVGAAKRAADLTRQLLAFSRKQIMQPRLLDLNEVIMNLAKMLSRLLGEHIDLQFDYDRHLPSIKADPSMLEQS